VQGVDQLFGNPISTAVQNRRRKAEKKAFLGEWHDFLYDSRADVYYVPVLEKGQFWQYLIRVQGVLRPEGGCQATAIWAKLLYGLGISPRKAIVSRALRTPDPAENHLSEIVLELDGEVVCHLVNLYGQPLPKRTVTAPELRREVEWATSLGTLSLIQDNVGSQSLAVSYKPGSDQSLAALKKPFASQLPGLSAPQNSDSLLPMYELALDLGTSDTAMAWPDKTFSLTLRAQAVLPVFYRLELPSRRNADPILITTSWLEEPDRILRRITTNGGTDSSFVADVLHLVDRQPEDPVFNMAKATLKSGACSVLCCDAEVDSPPPSPPEALGSPSPSSPRGLRRQQRQQRQSETDLYHYDISPIGVYPNMSPNAPAMWRHVLKGIVKEVLEGYKEEQPGSWKRMLHDNAEAVHKYLFWFNVLSGRRETRVNSSCIRVVELDRGSRLWFADGVQLQRVPVTPVPFWPYSRHTNLGF
jgi:hypothetical protein